MYVYNQRYAYNMTFMIIKMLVDEEVVKKYTPTVNHNCLKQCNWAYYDSLVAKYSPCMSCNLI